MYNGAGGIANVVDDNISKSFAMSLLKPPALTIYPDAFWKFTLSCLEAGTLSSSPSLLSSQRTLFSVLGEELIS